MTIPMANINIYIFFIFFSFISFPLFLLVAKLPHHPDFHIFRVATLVQSLNPGLDDRDNRKKEFRKIHAGRPMCT